MRTIRTVGTVLSVLLTVLCTVVLQGHSTLLGVVANDSATASASQRNTHTCGGMSADNDEELRVLFTAAEKGRSDIINTVVEALVAKAKLTTGDSFRVVIP